MNQTKTHESEKVGAITVEVEASFNFIATGLKLLKEQDYLGANNHVPLQSLASGFERLVKILLFIKDKHLTGDFPRHTRARERFALHDNGHGIEKMLDELLKYSETVPLMSSTQVMREDMDFLKNDAQFRMFLRIITDFSKYERYYYIDVIASDNRPQSKNVFNAFISFIYSTTLEMDTTNMTYKQEDEAALKAAVVCIEKGARAIARFFTHGFSDLGRMYYKDFSNLIVLNDKNLGTLSYAEKKTHPSDTYKAKSQFSFLYFKISLFAKSKSLLKANYADWPFTVPTVVVYSLRNEFFFVKIANEIFSLTGRTSRYFKLPVYHASKYRKPKDYATFLLEVAQDL